MDIPSIRRLLLRLCGTAQPVEHTVLASLGAGDWDALDRMAAQHRLRPLLHAGHRHNPAVPPDIARRWREAHRIGAMTALVQQTELRECCALLADAGFAPLVLKGGFLAWHVYPEAAQRPLRDLDILVTPQTAIAAFETLCEAGYTLAEPPEMEIADIVRLDKHMPPLNAPRGTRIELHLRLWEPDGRLDHALPAAQDAAVRARAMVLDGLAYPAPADMLVHLVVHAAYSHRLDCGPLVLNDIRHLVGRQTIDWDAFWQRGRNEGWFGSAGLLIALARRYHGDDAAPPPPPDFHIPAALLDSAPDLLLQDLDTRKTAGVAATALSGGMAALLRRLAGKKGVHGQAELICPLLSGPISILELATKEEWNGKEAQAGRDHRQAA